MDKKEIVTAEGLSAVLELKWMLENLDESKYIAVYDLLFASQANVYSVKDRHKIAEMKNLCSEYPKAAAAIHEAMMTGEVIPYPDTGIGLAEGEHIEA